MKTEISINGRSQTCIISNPVNSSLAASDFADFCNALPYLKVNERKYSYPLATVKCNTIKGIFTIEKLLNDVESFNEKFNSYEQF